MDARQLASEHLDIARRVAAYYSRRTPWAEYDDVYGEACLGLIEGAQRYVRAEGKKNLSARTYLWYATKRKVREHLSRLRNGTTNGLKQPAIIQTSIEDMYAASEPSMQWVPCDPWVWRRAKEALSPRHYDVLYRRLVREEQFKDIARAYNSTRQNIMYYFTNAIERLQLTHRR